MIAEYYCLLYIESCVIFLRNEPYSSIAMLVMDSFQSFERIYLEVMGVSREIRRCCIYISNDY